MLETPYPIDKNPDPYRKPLPGDCTDGAALPEGLPAGEHPFPAEPYSMPRLYRHSCTGLPYDVPEVWNCTPGDMPMLYDLWGLWS